MPCFVAQDPELARLVVDMFVSQTPEWRAEGVGRENAQELGESVGSRTVSRQPRTVTLDVEERAGEPKEINGYDGLVTDMLRGCSAL
jgi:hypothetical protein